MSIFSDDLPDDEYRFLANRMNRRDRIEREMVVNSLEEMCDLMCGGPEEEWEDDENDAETVR